MYNKPSCNDHHAFLPNFIFRECILLCYSSILNYPSQMQMLESREPYWKHNTYGPILYSLYAVPVSLQECEYDRHACGGGDCPAAPQSGASWTDAQPVQQDEGRGRPLAGRKCPQAYFDCLFAFSSKWIGIFFLHDTFHEIRTWPGGRTGGGVFLRISSKRRRRGRWWNSCCQETPAPLWGEEALRPTERSLLTSRWNSVSI